MKATAYLGLSFALLLGSSFAQTRPIITVGVIAPVTGLLSSAGAEMRNAAALKLVQSRIEFRNLGFDLRFKTFDDKSNVAGAARLARTVAADPNLLALIGPIDSQIAISVSEVLSSSNIGMVIGATGPRITTRGLDNVNRFAASDLSLVQATVRYMRDTLNARKVFVVSDEAEYSRALTSAMVSRIKADPQMSVTSFVRPDDDSPEAAIRAALAAKPDVIYIATWGGPGVSFLKGLRQAKSTLPVFAPETMAFPAVLQALGADAVGLNITVTAAPARAYAGATKFIQDYQKQYKTEPVAVGVQAFDALEVVLTALRDAINQNPGRRPTRLEVQKSLRNVNVETLITGKVRFNSVGERISSNVFQIRIGEDGNPRIVDILKIDVGDR